jgi:LPXTG-motif cell wall-anchored protein
LLVRAGLPKSAPRGSSGTNLALVAGIGIPGALVLAGAALLVARRRSTG